jgi:hypothetical protein
VGDHAEVLSEKLRLNIGAKLFLKKIAQELDLLVRI